jgi:hypothetical protein
MVPVDREEGKRVKQRDGIPAEKTVAGKIFRGLMKLQLLIYPSLCSR